MDFDKTFIIVLTIECIFLACLFIFVGNRLMASERDRADAEKWRNGQKPIGRLLAIEQDGEDLKVVGQFFEGKIPGIEASIGPMSIGYVKGMRSQPTYDVLDMPDPNTKTLAYRFKINRDEVVFGMDVKEFVDKEIANFKTRIRNDGWVMIGDGIATMEEYDIDFNQWKYRVEIVAARRGDLKS